jgi:hypothetical protein
MYAEKLDKFENAENLAGKAWQHAVNCDLLEQVKFKDCSMHCFHYQQLFELLFKHLLETRSEFGAYAHTHKLDRLLMQTIKDTEFNVDVEKYTSALIALTVCAEAYRYNFLLNCETYKSTVKNLNPLLDELAEFAKS